MKVDEIQQVTQPDRLILPVPGLPAIEARTISLEALSLARRLMPKLSGQSANRLQALYGPGYIGIRWVDPQVWFQEAGTKPRTMRSLAGRTIPMWIDDPTGIERQDNPRAKTRVTVSGKTQVLIFRRVGKLGEKGQHYPGAPGRVVIRELAKPNTRTGKIGGAISKFNVGVWWRHPGLNPRNLLHQGLIQAASSHGITPGSVIATDRRWK